jgi:hypothetical protein
MVVTGTPRPQEPERLLALCDAAGFGWTGLVCGEIDGAHWRGSVQPPTALSLFRW